MGTSCTALARAPVGPMPIGNPGEWATTDDYPTRALRYAEEGVVAFRLAVDAEGVPTSCKVTQTSESEALDTQTCNLMMARARFIPAADSAGKPTEGAYSNSVRWKIPEDGPITLEPAEVEFSFVVGPDGHPSDCKVVKVSGILRLPPGDPCNSKDEFVVPKGPDGKPITRRVRTRMSIEVEDVPPSQ